jgi:glutamyl-tRNA synthetase
VANYICLLGWSPKENREKMPMAETVKLFDLPQILRHNARFDIAKLQWLDGEYIREMGEERFFQLGAAALQRSGYKLDAFPPNYIAAALATCKGKIKRFGDLGPYAGFYFVDAVNIDPADRAREFTAESLARLQKLRDAFASLTAFAAPEIEKTLKAVALELGVKAGALVHPARMACTGAAAGPSLYHLLEVLGREPVLKRMDAALGTPPGKNP